MRVHGSKAINAWVATRMPGVLVTLVGLVLLAAFYPGALWTKVGAAAVLAVIVTAGSFVRVERGRKAMTRRSLFASVADRAAFPLPARARLDLSRPVVATGVAPDGDRIVYLLAFENAGRGRVLAVPAVVRGRTPAVLEYASVSEARRFLREAAIGVLPQSSWSDSIAEEIFGPQEPHEDDVWG